MNTWAAHKWPLTGIFFISKYAGEDYTKQLCFPNYKKFASFLDLKALILYLLINSRIFFLLLYFAWRSQLNVLRVYSWISAPEMQHSWWCMEIICGLWDQTWSATCKLNILPAVTFHSQDQYIMIIFGAVFVIPAPINSSTYLLFRYIFSNIFYYFSK